jgi:urease accessory protein
MRTPRLSIPALFLLASTATAAAHPGHAGDAGAMFLHPFTGLDHVLVMVAVGVLAARLGGRALWAVPLAFLTMMAAGSLLGGAGTGLPAVELGVTLSVIGVGAVLVLGARPSVAVSAVGAAAIATLHGYTHGGELGVTSLTMALPMLAATALLIGLGLGVGAGLGLGSRRLLAQPAPLADRVLGTLMIAIGAALLFS